MKKLHYLAMICLAAFFLGAVVCCTEKENNGSTGNGNGGTNGGFTDEYVDLGLPSGTKWKSANEVNAADTMYDFYTYDEAVAAFEDALPTKGQVQELKDGCQSLFLLKVKVGAGYHIILQLHHQQHPRLFAWQGDVFSAQWMFTGEDAHAILASIIVDGTAKNGIIMCATG